ncbi:MAG TPA: matrixin family metalloprotease [Chloroflexota bacterium]|nr:matrixin family metalloprotease [Chloroflexota bacterium]
MRTNLRLLGAALAGLAALLAAPAPSTTAQGSAYALELLGAAWDHTTITYSLQADADVPPAALAQVRAAVREWNAQLARLGGHYGTLRLAPASGLGADVPIAVRTQAAPTSGLTSPDMAYQTAGCWLQQAPVVVSVLDADGAPLPDATVFTVAAHELGHALGLGHARSPDDLMYPTVADGRRSPSALDLRGIRAAFSWLDGTASTPGAPRCPRARGVQ